MKNEYVKNNKAPVIEFCSYTRPERKVMLSWNESIDWCGWEINQDLYFYERIQLPNGLSGLSFWHFTDL